MTTSPPKVVRNVLRMVVLLIDRGYESLYLDSVMSPSGTHWRYQIGAMEQGRWPARRGETVEGSIGGGSSTELEWARASDMPDVLAEKFALSYPAIVRAARRPNPEYATWFREMEQRTAPTGVPIFWCDYGPDHEYLFLWNGPSEFRMEMPPGYRRAGD